jgi:hypothetical protein
VVAHGKDDENFAVRRDRLFRSHHDLENKKTERNTDLVLVTQLLRQGLQSGKSGQEALVNEKFVNENFAVDVAKPWAGYTFIHNLIKGYIFSPNVTPELSAACKNWPHKKNQPHSLLAEQPEILWTKGEAKRIQRAKQVRN